MKPRALALLTLLTTAAGAQPLVTNGQFAGGDAGGLPEGWQLAVFHDSPTPRVSVVTVDGRRALQLAFETTHPVYCLAVHQPAPPLDTDGAYVVRFALQASGSGAGDMSVALSGGPGCELPCSRMWHLPRRDGQWHEVELRLPAQHLRPDGSVLELCFNNQYRAGDWLRLADLRSRFEPDPPLRVSPTDPPSGVVFTDSPSQVLAGVLRVTRPAAGRPARVRLTSAAAPERTLAAQDLVATHPITPWRFDLGALPVGQYVVAAELLGAEGAATITDRLLAWRIRPTATTTRVKDGKVYLGDKPIVLMGTYHVADWIVDVTNTENRRLGAPELTRAAMLDGVAKQGFDTFLYTSGIPPSDFLRDCQSRRLTLVPTMAGVGREWGGAPLVEQVAPVADDPTILAWGGYDEPQPHNMEGAVTVYRDLKTVSPRKLVVTSFNDPSPLLALQGHATPADLILMDIYTIFKPRNDLSWVGRAVREAVQYARAHPGLAVGVAPQAFIYGGGPEPTPQQLRAQLYLGLVNGARAFFPYAYAEDYANTPFSAIPGQPRGMSLNPRRQRWWLPDSRLWRALPRCFAELRELEPLILADGGDVPVAVEGAPVQVLARVVGGEGRLIVVNPLGERAEATLSLPFAPRGLAPWFGTRPAQAQGRKLALSFRPYEVKVFRFRP